MLIQIFDKISSLPFINWILLRLFVYLDNISYKAITVLATRRNNGVHPKYRILNFNKFIVDNLNVTDHVLDIGCGSGINSYEAALKSKLVVGIDIDEKNVRLAKQKYSLPNLNFSVGDATDYNFSSQFDKIILSNVLEHVENRIDFLKRLTKVSNFILLRVPMITRDWVAVYKKENGFEYHLNQGHFIEYTLEELELELQNGGWRIERYSIQFGEFWGVIKRI